MRSHFHLLINLLSRYFPKTKYFTTYVYFGNSVPVVGQKFEFNCFIHKEETFNCLCYSKANMNERS